MRKIFNTLKYGGKKVKRSLIIAILAGLVTVSFGVMTFIMSSMLCFFITIMAAFITISLVQTFMIVEGDNPSTVIPNDRISKDVTPEATEVIKPVVDRNKKKNKIKSNISSEEEGQGIIHNVNEVDKIDETERPKKSKKKKVKKEKIKKEKIKKDKTKKRMKDSSKSQPEDEIIKDEAQVKEQIAVTEQISVMEQNYQPEERETAVDAQEVQKDDEEEPKNTKFKVITADTAATYTKRKIKKTLHKYKVMKDHRMVIVDRCDRLHIYQTPAYVWIQDNQFHILLIEEEPRLLMVPIFRITEISYLRKQPADEEKDYKLFKKSTILTDSFRPYLPAYNHSNKTTDLKAYKNLYGIFQGIYFTNNSAKNLFDLLGVDFYVEDKVTTSNKVNIFFKEAYKANIKLRDNVLDANGYAESITNILEDMAHSNISHIEFKDTLNLMIKNKLITDEYANHYMDVRNSIRG